MTDLPDEITINGQRYVKALNLPTRNQGWSGPIEVGMRFVWGPRTPSSQELVVTMIDNHPAWSERLIWTTRLDGTMHSMNEEGRFRASVEFIPLPYPPLLTLPAIPVMPR